MEIESTKQRAVKAKGKSSKSRVGFKSRKARGNSQMLRFTKLGHMSTKGSSRTQGRHMLRFTKLGKQTVGRTIKLPTVAKSKTSKKTAKVHRISATSKSTDYLAIGLTDLATRLFGAETIEKAKHFVPDSGSEGESNSEESASQNSVRKIWELASPTTQCKNTIGGYYDGHTLCWICGLSIQSNVVGMTAECEHILPIAQAVIFLMLYPDRDRAKALTQSQRADLDLEYGWAHRVCNQEKSDACPLQMVTRDSVQSVEIFDKGIDVILKKIWDSKRSYAPNFIANLHPAFSSLENFKHHRKTAIKERYERIVNRINIRNIDGSLVPGHAALTVLSGLACATIQDYTRQELHSILSPDAVNDAKAAFDDKIKLDIRKELGLDAIDGVGGLASIMTVYEKLDKKIEEFLNRMRDTFQGHVRYSQLFKELNIPTNYDENIHLIVENIQSDSFKFVIQIYPRVFGHFKEEKATYDFIGNFLVYKFMENINDTAKASSAEKPRKFFTDIMGYINNAHNELTAQYNAYNLEQLNIQYNQFHQLSAAEALIDVSDIARVAGLLERVMADK
jgi:hypothetical protein